MTVFLNDGKFDDSNVEFRDERIVRYDKKNRTTTMRYIDYGLGAFCADVFAEPPDGVACDLAMVYKRLLSTNELAAFEVSERFYEIALQGIEETVEYLRSESAKQ